MRHKYETRGVVLARTHSGEANTLVTLITSELGLVSARAQSLRKPGAKLAHALTTFAESSLVLVRGKEGWRVAGAVLEEDWFARIRQAKARETAGRISNLLLRLVGGEVHDPRIFSIITGFFGTLSALPEDAYENAEILAALRTLSVLGLDAGEIPGETNEFTIPLLERVGQSRAEYISRINHGIAASGL